MRDRRTRRGDPPYAVERPTRILPAPPAAAPAHRPAQAASAPRSRRHLPVALSARTARATRAPRPRRSQSGTCAEWPAAVRASGPLAPRRRHRGRTTRPHRESRRRRARPHRRPGAPSPQWSTAPPSCRRRPGDSPPCHQEPPPPAPRSFSLGRADRAATRPMRAPEGHPWCPARRAGQADAPRRDQTGSEIAAEGRAGRGAMRSGARYTVTETCTTGR